MQAAVKRAAPLAVGVGTAAAAAANNNTAECRSAVVVTNKQLEEACGLIKNDLSKSQTILGLDGTPWIMPRSTCDSQDFDLLELSASVASDPAVQRVLREKYEQQGLSSLRSSLPCTHPALSTRTPSLHHPHPVPTPQHRVVAELELVFARHLAAAPRRD